MSMINTENNIIKTDSLIILGEEMLRKEIFNDLSVASKQIEEITQLLILSQSNEKDKPNKDQDRNSNSNLSWTDRIISLGNKTTEYKNHKEMFFNKMEHIKEFIKDMLENKDENKKSKSIINNEEKKSNCNSDKINSFDCLMKKKKRDPEKSTDDIDEKTKPRKNKVVKPDEPKKPQKAFNFFLREKREELKKLHPELKYQEIKQMVCKEWKDIEVDKKGLYTSMEQKEFLRYSAELNKFNNNFRDEEVIDINKIYDN
jgi:hypothetical protein